MFRRSTLLLCGMVVGASALSGVAYAAPDDGADYRDARAADPGDDRGDGRGAGRGGAERARCAGAGVVDRDRRKGGDDRRESTVRHAEADDSDEPDGSGGSEESDGTDEAAPISCGGRGGAPGVNSSDCGSSLLPAGAGVTRCAAPAARRGQDG